MVRIQFIPNQDGITTSFFADSRLIDNEIPFVPNKLVDSRGISLFNYCAEKNLHFETDLEFVGETFDEKRELKRLFDYMKKPIYVWNTIFEIEAQKTAPKRIILRQASQRESN